MLNLGIFVAYFNFVSQVTIADPSEDELYKMRVDLATGFRESVALPSDAIHDDPLTIPGSSIGNQPTGPNALPKHGLL